MKPQLRFPLRRQLKLAPQYLQLPRQPYRGQSRSGATGCA